jgi:hypothetical protein
MDTTPEYVKMAGCPEIQGGWKPKVGDYVWRKYTIFGEELDRTLWPEDERQEVIILHFKSSVDGYYHAVNADGDERVFASEEDMAKAVNVFLPRQDQLQEMVQKPEQATWLHVGSWFGHWLHDQYKGEAHPDGRSMEQLWLAYIMGEKHNKRWDGDSWVELH